MNETKIISFIGMLFLGICMSFDSQGANENIFRYVITETGAPTSLDPLEADNGNNLSVARMIYATPLEVNDENRLSSHVLDSFKYDAQTRTIHWVVKTGLLFDDGTVISPGDVAFAVARMAFTRPAFPVLEAIEGIKQWAKGKHPLKSLPSGIVIEGQGISIRLSKNIEHPLFRFCLELFSIIPQKCVDPETSAISCKEIPASGYYSILEKSKDGYLFSKRDRLPINGAKVPEKIRFGYISADDLSQVMTVADSATVMAGNEATFSESDMKAIGKKFVTKFAPASRFSMLLINPEVQPFTSKKCRQFFAREFRESYGKIVGKPKSVEASIFTKILPGYVDNNDLSRGLELSSKDIVQCKTAFARGKINWGYAESEKRSIFIETLKRTAEKIGARLSDPLIMPSRKEMTDLFAAGKISVFNASSGFWALDPAGDTKMLFTPNLHKVLKFASADPTLQKLINALGTDPGSYAKVNRYLFEEANLNVYAHLRRFFASSNGDILADVPFAITSPAPWQVFKVK